MSVEADVLIFRLAGPMAGFGAPAVGEQRPCWSAPGKSAVLGLVAAALGLRRTEGPAHAVLHDALGLAVRIDREGRPLRDFHTAQVQPAGRGTPRAVSAGREPTVILSDRRYLSDGAWTIALWTRSPGQIALETIAEALRRPRFPLYLGRRACPLSAPPRPRLYSQMTLAHAFAEDDALAGAQPPPARHAEGFTVWTDAGHPLAVGYPVLRRRQRRDGLYDRSHWLFDEREETEILLCAGPNAS